MLKFLFKRKRPKCKHKWVVVHNEKYDNIGFREHYYMIQVCRKCGKRKITKV